MKDRLLDSLKLLDGWLEKNNWRGYDPYDLLGTKVYLQILSLHLSYENTKYFTYPFTFLERNCPKLIRKALRVRPQHNAKAFALFARSYLNLYKEFGETYLKKALKSLKWLMDNYSRGYSGYCWGYPFDWMTRPFIPKGTPSIVVSCIAANAFLDAYEILRAEEYLNVAKSTCNFLLDDLNVDAIDEDIICFSYTPLDHSHVHNANLFGASLLARVYKHTKIEEYRKLAEKAVKFTTLYQNSDGSWYYRAPLDKYRARMYIDNYHTGFILESLYVIREVLKDEFLYDENLEKGIEFYRDHLFVKETIPKFTPRLLYPIDIHDVAQGIITFSRLQKLNPQYGKIAEKMAKWAITNMQDEDGYFYHRVYRHRIDKTPYVRWGQAWMLTALSTLGGTYHE